MFSRVGAGQSVNFMILDRPADVIRRQKKEVEFFNFDEADPELEDEFDKHKEHARKQKRR